MAALRSRLPETGDFPSECVVEIRESGDGKPAVNILLLLHSLGDSASNFSILGQRLNLPETASVTLQGPGALPFDLTGFHFGDDIIFDQASGQMDMDLGFSKSTKLLKEVINDILINKCGYRHRQVYLFGLGQGGMVALSVAKALGCNELGGVVSLGGPLPGEVANVSVKASTPVLVAHGSSNSAVSVTAASRIKSSFSTPSFTQWRRAGDGMPTNRDEMLPVMRFLASRMQSRAGVPHGAQEIA